MTNLLQITAQYSNALLVAAIPYVSDFAAKVNLPIKQPVTMGEIAHANIAKLSVGTDVVVWLTNGYWFGISHDGYIGCYHAPMNFFWEQGEDVTKYAGQDHMTTNEVISMAREILIKLGYETRFTHSERTPTLEGPSDTPQGHMPYCRVKWQWPNGENTAPAFLNDLSIDINTETKAFVGMSMVFCRTNDLPIHPLKINMEPELEKNYQKGIRPKMVFDTNAPKKFVP